MLCKYYHADLLQITVAGNSQFFYFIYCYVGCINLSFAYVEGESLLMALKDVALSSGRQVEYVGRRAVSYRESYVCCKVTNKEWSPLCSVLSCLVDESAWH